MKIIILIVMAIFLVSCDDESGTSSIIQEPEIDEADLPNSPSSFYKAKNLLYGTVHKGHSETFYCGCKYTSTNRVYITACGVAPRLNEERAKRLEAEHIFPASHFGQDRACWREDLCTDSNGEAYGGRSCCEKIDPVFEAAHNDLQNLQPSIGEINGDRSNRQYGMIEGEERLYGQCDFEIDWDLDVVEPGDHVRGNVARTYFYMRDTYGINLSRQQTQLFEVWNREDPVDDWERERNKRIKAIQGVGNKYIE